MEVSTVRTLRLSSLLPDLLQPNGQRGGRVLLIAWSSSWHVRHRGPSPPKDVGGVLDLLIHRDTPRGGEIERLSFSILVY